MRTCAFFVVVVVQELTKICIELGQVRHLVCFVRFNVDNFGIMNIRLNKKGKNEWHFPQELLYFLMQNARTFYI